MAVLENGFPFDNVEYDATALGAWLSTRTRGVFSSDDHYAVTAAGGMQVNVSAGIAWLKMNEQWGMVAPNPATITLSVDVGDTILNRIDAVCLRIDKNQSTEEVVIKKGALAATPIYPALVRDLNYDEVFLAAISVPAGTTELNAGLITDLRLNETYCGIMRDGVTGIPTAQIQAQAEALMRALEDAINGVIDGSQYMLKTQYAPDATALVDDSGEAPVLRITSDNARVGSDYDLRFQIPDGYEAGMPLVVDGTAVTVTGSDMETAELDAAPGAVVSLVRKGARVFFKSGGGSLKLKLIVIASQEDLPLNADDGTIAIISTTPVNGYQLNKSTVFFPGNDEGRVYIDSRVGSHYATAINLGKDNQIFTAPISCYQVQSGVLVPVISYLAKDGSWLALSGALIYERGIEYIPVGVGLSATGATNTVRAPIKLTDRMEMNLSAATQGTYAMSGFVTNEPVDLRGWQTFNVVFSGYTATADTFVLVTSTETFGNNNINPTGTLATINSRLSSSNATNETTLSLNIASLDRDGFLAARAVRVANGVGYINRAYLA